MAYTPVPAVAANDWIDEIFINTYWKDNFAAGVPDVFSAKGQLAVGLGVDSMGVLNVGANDTVLIADSTQATGLKWGTRSKVTLFTTQPAVTGLTTSIGDQTLTASTAISGVPSTAVAIFLVANVLWLSVASNPLLIFCTSVGNNGVLINGLLANVTLFNAGLVPLNGGNFVKRILTTAPNAVAAFCAGYIE